MKTTFRKSMIWLHTYLGLITGWLLFTIFVTGTLSYFTPEITYWMMPERQAIVIDEQQQNQVYTQGQRYQVEKSIDYLETHATNATSWRVYLPTQRDHHWYVQWREGKTRHLVNFNKDAIPIETTTDTKGGLFFRNFHYTLQLRGYGGRYIAGVAAMAMLLALFTGIYTHRRFFKDFFTLRKGKVTKWTTDFHALIGIVTLPFCLMICISAIMIYAIMYMPFSANMHFEKGERGVNKAIIPSLPPLDSNAQAINRLSENQDIAYSAIVTNLQAQWQEPNAIRRITVESPSKINSRFIVERTKSLSVSNRAERLVYSSYTAAPLEGYADESAPATIRRIMYGLHQANFATIGLRWLLFSLGVLSCALIATGLVIWTNQRRINYLKAVDIRTTPAIGKNPSKLPISLQIMEKGNVVAIMGLAIATSAFLLANRIIPTEVTNRSGFEINTFFITWLCSAIHAAVRPIKYAWYEQACAAAISYLVLAGGSVWLFYERTMHAFNAVDTIYLSFMLMFGICSVGFIALAYWLRGRLDYKRTPSYLSRLSSETCTNEIQNNTESKR
ncbi:PepSY-associated TM helix domain-containing protein [Alteromonas sp. CI.11.F.A3]|uniref:PepSY-associated TM helix domain-containing protein n=1 Tax=Alteromonas sp. CI.11.F.A3 TaxID=3079555 RepID=UPI002942F161|nr:PepSY-associated TM helix domain-containing protein [Alteromonas sp. CI.11.F.A3]WOI39310.1 PepSY-associated TM helix domain-containing protein [Alteromonas sp. CI.11.F.A3]